MVSDKFNGVRDSETRAKLLVINVIVVLGCDAEYSKKVSDSALKRVCEIRYGIVFFFTHKSLVNVGRMLFVKRRVYRFVIFGNFFNKMSKKICENKKKEGKTPETEAAVFSGLEVNMKGREFHGAELNGIFGGMTYDLKEAVIHEDCVIQASAVFGGIDICQLFGFSACG